MFKVADYLIQAQSSVILEGFAELRPLDTRGGSSAICSIWILGLALTRLVRGRIDSRLAGVHVNMAERLSLVRKAVVVVVSRALGLPVVLHLHAAQLHHIYRALPRPLQTLIRWIFSLPSVCIVLGTTGRRFVTQELNVSPEKVAIVINGVPAPTVPRRRAEQSDIQRILFLGNLSERKGVSDLLRALAFPEFARDGLEVTIAGGGDVEGYREQAQCLGIDSFTNFAGWVDQAEAAYLLANADVLILPSYDEGLPLVILEALANGVAVVCTAVGEIPSVLTDGVDVCFVEPGDVSSIAEGLRRVLSSPTLREALERNGRMLFERQFSLSGFFNNVADIHQKAFGTSGRLNESASASQR